MQRSGSRDTAILLILTVLLGWLTFKVYQLGIEKATLGQIVCARPCALPPNGS